MYTRFGLVGFAPHPQDAATPYNAPQDRKNPMLVNMTHEEAVKAVKRELREIEKSVSPVDMALIATISDNAIERIAGNMYFKKHAT